MEKKSDLSDANLLIDFSSSPIPVKKVVLHSPLIPIPASSGNRLSSSPTNNPFDIVAKQTNLSPDPFEIILSKAQSQGKNQCSTDSKENYAPNIFEKIEANTEVNYKYSSDSQKTDSNTSFNVPSIKSSNPSSANNVVDTSVTVAEADSQSLTVNELSNEEDLKAVIAKRINNCVRQTLNGSLPVNATSGPHTLNRRSLSFITESKKNEKSDKLNKSFSFSQSGQFNLELEQMKSPDSSIGLLDISNPMSSFTNEASANNDSVFLPQDNDLVFKEANKLARTFSKIAESFCHDTGLEKDDEDLFACKPRWLYAADSSEDEEEKLKNDPALNVRVIITPTKKAESKSSITALVKKARRSLDIIQNKSTLDETNMKSAVSVETIFRDKVQDPSEFITPSIVPPGVANLAESDPVAPIKLKKRTGPEVKKGPMRAVMPIQSMAKESTLLHGKSKKSNRELSPLRKQNSLLMLDTPKTKASSLGMRPVASSTPNKPGVVFTPSPLALPSPSNNQRRSLGSAIPDNQMRKSRISDVEGSRQRSNSASSKIPTKNMCSSAIASPSHLAVVKPLKGTLNKSPVKPKSTSDLRRHMVPPLESSQSISKTNSLNVKAKLSADVKSKLKGGLKSAITGKFTGKKSKTIVGDKENRVPS